MPFRQKLVLVLVLLVGISCGLLLWLSLRKANKLAFELIQEKVYAIAVSTAPRVDGDLVKQLTDPDQDGSDIHKEVRNSLREVRDANLTGDLPVRFIYIIRPIRGGGWEYVVDAEEEGGDKSYLGDVVEFRNESEKPELQVARADGAYTEDSFGTWLTAFAPVRDSSGEAVALVGVDVAAHKVQDVLGDLLVGDLLAMLAALILAAALAAWLSHKVTRPLTELRDFVRAVGKGQYERRVAVQGNDEFGELARAVNQMVEGLEERESLRGALVHYVRSQAADGKLAEGEAADEIRRRVTVLVAELRGFSQLSSRLGSERVFALLNEFFAGMIDVILRHGGSLEKSSDEKVIAIFGSNRDDAHQERRAVEAGLAMQRQLEDLVEDWGIRTDAPVVLAIGIHSGEAKGRQGEHEDRLDYESVHRVHDVATSIAGLGGQQDHALIVSDVTAEKLHHTFPLVPIEEDALDFGIFGVTMPRPARR